MQGDSAARAAATASFANGGVFHAPRVGAELLRRDTGLVEKVAGETQQIPVHDAAEARHIADRLGYPLMLKAAGEVADGTIYLYFKNKEDLLIQTLEEEMHEASAELKFEYAARLRDEINDLRRELRDAQ